MASDEQPQHSVRREAVGQLPAVRPELLGTFPRQFAALRALDEFRRAHPPTKYPAGDFGAQVVFWTYARSTKTFGAALVLAGAGYGEQACMLNRALYEDMLLAHWAHRYPERAADTLPRYERWANAKLGRTLNRFKAEPVDLPTLTQEEEEALDEEFLNKTWAGRSLTGVYNAVRKEWPPRDRRTLDAMHHLIHDANNAQLHHVPRSLASAGELMEEGGLRFFVGPSEKDISVALFGTFYSFANTASLALDDGERHALNELYTQHIGSFKDTR